MALDLSIITPLIRQLWTDSMDITGYSDSENADGSTEPANLTPKASERPCKLSYKRPDNPDNKDFAREPIKLTLRVSCDVTEPVAKGDFVRVSRKNCQGTVLQVYEGAAGLPAMFQSHQEFEIVREGQA